MGSPPRSSRFGAVLLALAMLVMLPGTAAATSDMFLATTLTGAEEVPGPGDADAIGAAALLLNADTGRVCWAYAVSVRRIAPITAAHIHVGPAGVAGPVVVTLAPASARTGISIGCTTAAPGLVAAIVADPAAYYVNVHNAEFPAGALRGQLG